MNTLYIKKYTFLRGRALSYGIPLLNAETLGIIVESLNKQVEFAYACFYILHVRTNEGRRC